MENEEILRTLSYDVVLPTHLVINKKIQPFAKLFYGIVRNLCRVEGYCWATNEYFSNITGYKPRQIQNFINRLEEEGYLEREMVPAGDGKSFNQTERKLFISDKFKKFLSTQKIAPPHAKNCTHKEDIVKEDRKEKESIKEKASQAPFQPRKARSAAASQISLDRKKMSFDGISLEDIKAWRDAFPNVNIDKELKACQLWAGTMHRANYRKSINTWMSNVSKANGSGAAGGYTEIQVTGSEQDEEINRNYASAIEDGFSTKRAANYDVMASSQKISFVIPNGGSYDVPYNLKAEEFKKRCQRAKERMGL